ncbi:MAG: BNR repeat-containing protein [Bacteroidota bacterium]|nr:BNR repeat-containing protein [Bacteroidota bacterium]
MKRFCIFVCLFAIGFIPIRAKNRMVPVAKGWAGNSINAVVFRKNSLVTYKDIQFIAFYSPEGRLTLGKRKINSTKWEVVETAFPGNVRDAHNSISIMADGDGYLHVSWDHHGNALNYAHSLTPLSLQLTDRTPMTGLNETNVTYPEFYKMPDGNLIFLYRDGQSGKGNLVMNRYDVKKKTWKQMHSNLIDGEGRHNAYWQACVDKTGVFHISWVWRSSPDVASNHDLLYARSSDGGVSWEKSTGEKYYLPINAANAEFAFRIKPNSELINQTSMTTDEAGNPFIVSYWRTGDSDIPQYHVVFNSGNAWQELNSGFRKTSFTLSGAGTKRIPISRPQILVRGKGDKALVELLFRDAERADKVSRAICDDISQNKWEISDLTDAGVGAWEPSFDTELWRNKKQLNIFVQKVEQIDGEGLAHHPAEMVYVLETK